MSASTQGKRKARLVFATFIAIVVAMGTTPSQGLAAQDESAAPSAIEVVSGDENEATLGAQEQGDQGASAKDGENATANDSAATDDSAATGVVAEEQVGDVSVSYRVHVQTYGDQAPVRDGAVAGTSGQSKRLEAIWLELNGGLVTEAGETGNAADVSGSIEYRTHVQSYGWQDWVSDGAMSGTSGEAKRLEAIQIQLTGDVAQQYDVWYRVHAQRYGWMAWAKNGEIAGTSGLALRLEAIQVLLVRKDAPEPGDVEGIQSAVPVASLETPIISYRAHVQTYGWQDWVTNGQIAGTSGEGKRIEGLEATYSSPNVLGGIRYKTHVQTYGWQDWSADGATAGTSGESKRLEALCIELTGDASEYFDVWYRTHVQTLGWLGWAKNGDKAGTGSLSKRMEAVEIRVLPKGSAAPGSTDRAFVTFTTGDQELDDIIETIIRTRTGRGSDALRKAFDYVVSFPYIDGATAYRGDWRTWSVPLAKQMYNRPGGNCYHYGSLMAWIARGLGYDARAVSGEVQSGVMSWSYHGWCEITQDGVQYVLDPDLQKYIPDRNFFMVTYDQAPTYYTAY